MARIVRPRNHGGPDMLTVVDVEVPTPRAGEVVVEVRAAGVNPVDWKLYSGAFHAVDDEHQDVAGVAESMPDLGMECAGVVTAVGDDVDGMQVGDEVIVYPVTAAYADHVTVPASSLIPKPERLSWEQAGGLMLAGLTAAHALHAADVRAGETVLIHGGAGGVGLMAVQLAVQLGATVVATAGERNHELLRGFGAIPVTYGAGLAGRVEAAAPQGIDAAIDTVGTDEALDVSLQFAPDPARVASIAGSDRRFGTGIKLLGYGPGQDAGTEYRASVRQHLADLAGAGDIRVIVAAALPLAGAARAHAFGQAGGFTGKIVLLP
ncbi:MULTISPECIES: NADP-dependent oxidoreductase [unclassified Curtobacterium]|uniref:NADP-dependent oxidoreductase n=1 Tax=unclassified Curtobacterium TaxID=257496 RepID=UPI0008DC7964|nr:MULTISPECIES: NADP-dependent oxidoreductase [unclassified Curtobacterium]OIH99592.1 alcohol dehydrogenase [Curtobacterium sp. MCBA15_003]OII30573.1 alcohol dehydrogenase [Curtobacterium sp. MMLR14_006]